MFAHSRRPFLFLLGSALVAGLALWRSGPSSGLTDLVYATPDGTTLTLDLDFPPTVPPPYPVVLFAPPDGEWPHGFKREPRCRMLLDRLTRHGYAVATVHYRLPGKYRFPAQIEDSKAAIRWLRANAARYGLDARRIGVVGVSAGAYGGCMLGTTGPEDGYEGTGGNAEQSSRVQAVVCLGAPGDFIGKDWPEQLEAVYLRPFLGASYAQAPAVYARASPSCYARADAPPFLLFHSRGDLVVPVKMVRTFVDRLRRARVPVTLVEEEAMEHVWSGPKLEQAIERALHFLDRHLRP
jgi:acetyl esterase/lipase